MNYEEWNNFTVLRETKGGLPNLPFISFKEQILGRKYDLSLVFVGTKKATELYTQFKNKNHPLDILSFPLDPETGEIIMCLSQLRAHAKQYNRSFTDHIMFMFIHGCLHLSGHTHYNDVDHALMEIEENKYFSIYSTTKK